MASLTQALVPAVARLRAAGVEDAPRDARLLLAHAAGIAPDRLTLHLQDALDDDAAGAYEALIARRCAREPVSHLTGQRLFWGRNFKVSRDVLDPRPETEILIVEALKAPFARVLDLGTGSGAILLTLLAECPLASGVASDLSPAALAVARSNAMALGVDGRARFVEGSWFAPVDGEFDLIVSNPPYIAADEMAGLSPDVLLHEPHMALSPGGDGLQPYRDIAAGALAHLAPKGRLLVEIGPTQGAAVAEFFAKAGLVDVRVIPDFDGRDRVVAAARA